MFRNSRPSLFFNTITLLLAGSMVVLSLSPILSGRGPNFLGIVLNLPVVAALLADYRHTKTVVKAWALLPIISMALYLLIAMQSGSVGDDLGAAFWLVTGTIGLIMFCWANFAFPRKLV